MKTNKFFSLLAAIMMAAMFTACSNDDNPVKPSLNRTDTDTWDASTKTLTVNNNPGENAYDSNTEIQHIVFADNVTNIGKAAFDGCGNLESVTFAENSQLETINGWAFGYCGKLTTITIPASVTFIGDNAFDECQNLSVINILAQTPPSLGTHAFAHTAEDFKIFVPKDCVDAYKTAYPDFADRIKPIMGDDVTD